MGDVLRRRRSVSARARIVGLIYLVTSVALGLVSPRIVVGFTVAGSRATEMLLAIAISMLTFLGVVYSLLFLVIEFASTSLTPRLTLFRDASVVAHGFALLSAVIVYSLTATLAIANEDRVSGLVPLIAFAGIVAAVWVYRLLQTRAFRSIQFASVLADVSTSGRSVIDSLYPPDDGNAAVGVQFGCEAEPVALDAQTYEIRWKDPAGVIQLIDVRQVVEVAERSRAVVRFSTGVGDAIQEQQLIATASGSARFDERDLLRAIVVGNERSFDQDPAFALRVLADIALRALSPAINDPTTAVQALDRIESLLRALIGRDLGIGHIAGADGTLRVVLDMPTWEDYVSVALDELVTTPNASILVRQRTARLIDDLVAIAPADRAATLRAREQALTPYGLDTWPGRGS